MLAEEVKSIVGAVVKNLFIISRIKDSEILRKKMCLKNTKNIFSIDDVYGIRILVESIDEAYAVLEKISQTFSGFLDHDYIKKPKECPSINGKVLRLLQFIAYKNGVSFEIQITTVSFNDVNELLHGEYHRRKYCS